MAVQINTYAGLSSAISAWLARDGDTDIAARVDDFIALCETRLYLGKVAMPALQIPAHEAIRIPEMVVANTGYALSNGVAQPADMLELIEIKPNGARAPCDIVEESILDSYDPNASNIPSKAALSGLGFRFWPDPGAGGYTATLRYYGRLATPSGSNPSNWILSNAPGVYLNGCLLEAAIFTQDPEAAKYYAMLYAADVSGLNERRNRILASAHAVKISMRGRTP